MKITDAPPYNTSEAVSPIQVTNDTGPTPGPLRLARFVNPAAATEGKILNLDPVASYELVTSIVTLADEQKALVRWDETTNTLAFLTGPVTPPTPAASLPEATLAFFEVK